MYEQWDQEEESTYDKIETKLSYAIGISSSIIIIDFFFFTASIYYMVHGKGLTMIIPSIIIFLGSLFLLLVVQQKIVDMEKEINPEKKGSIYDMNFQSKWMESCDEAEQLMTYKAAFKSYQVTNILCIAFMVLLSLLSLCFKVGLMPAGIVTIIWFVMQAIYVKECIKLSKVRVQKTLD